MIQLSIVIVNWNSSNLLLECVNSLLTSKSINYEIIVVDNNSSDNSLFLVENKNIKFIKNSLNKGFSFACNQGFNVAIGEYILVLNPDVKVEPTTLYETCKFIENDPTIGVIGVANYDENRIIKPSCSRFSTPLNIFYTSIGLSKLFPKFFESSSLILDFNYNKSAEVDQVIGAFMLFRKELLKIIGNFDEQFFVYYEDMDFCKRVWQNKFRVYYNSNIGIYHKGMGTTESVKSFRLALSVESRLKYIKKYFNFGEYYLVCFISLIIEPFFRIILSAKNDGLNGIKEVIKGYKILFYRLIKKNP